MRPITTVGIVGAGTMGSAIGQKFAIEGMSVILTDRDQLYLDRGLEMINGSIQEGRNRNLFSETEAIGIQSRITTTTDLEGLADCGLIIEAVYEDREVKAELLRNLSGLVGNETVIATNTSSFTVSEMSAHVRQSERFLGLHFFYHASKNRLVEVIRGPETDPQIFDHVVRTMQRTGKDPIICSDSPGFVVNRFFVPWLNEAARLLDEEVASAGAIDTVAREIFNCGMGPFALMNATGVPIAMHAANALGEALGSFYKPSIGLQNQAHLNDAWLIDELDFSDKAIHLEIANRLIGATLLPCGQLLDEKVCTADEIHKGARIGLRWGTSPIDLMQSLGTYAVQSHTNTLAETHGTEIPVALSNKLSWNRHRVISKTVASTKIITIDRPYSLNALNSATIADLDRAFSHAEEDPSTENIILTGSGKAFVAGADISFFLENINQGNLNLINSFTAAGSALFSRIDRSPKNVVAAVRGMALGGGLELALSADVIVATPSAIFAFPETGIGIYPGLGGTQRTVDRIGAPLTKYLIYTGQVLTAQDALEIGLIDQIQDSAGIDEMLAEGNFPARKAGTITGKWTAIAKIFEVCCVDEFLADDGDLPSELHSDVMQPILRKVRRKAPIALKLAEQLIDGHAGPQSELEHLTEIFSTADALTGLKSVGGPPPQFSGS